jgi:phage FluMu protein Com
MTATAARHGKPATYKGGCRCPKCREANRVYQAAANKRRAADPALADRAGHGRYSTYINYACRCPACRAANSRRLRNQRALRAILKGQSA